MKVLETHTPSGSMPSAYFLRQTNHISIYFGHRSQIFIWVIEPLYSLCLAIIVTFLSHDVAPGSQITSCNKIDKPLVVYRFSGNVMMSIITLRKIRNSYTMGCSPVRGDNPRALAMF